MAMDKNIRKPLLEVRDLKKHFKVGRKALVKAVDGVSFLINKGETLGLVGESGCGKTTCGRTILKLYNASDGYIAFNGKDISRRVANNELLRFRKDAQMIFQDLYSALDPRMTIGEIISEGIKVHFNENRARITEMIDELLLKVGMTGDFANRFPHELSGGQRQRVGIARALAVDPRFIVCDEPISALDVSIQAQILNLLISLQQERDLSYLFISHDLSVVKHISDRVGVMYLGNLVELAGSDDLFENPKHPYTNTLLSAIPAADPDIESGRIRLKLQGEVPSPVNPPTGCKFRTRCQLADVSCSETIPELREISPGHFTACLKDKQKI